MLRARFFMITSKRQLWALHPVKRQLHRFTSIFAL